MHPYQVLLRPLINEKTQWQVGYEKPQYAFEVDQRANKQQVKEAVEIAFNVTVLRVNVVNLPAKRKRNPRAQKGMVRRTSSWKKAIVQVKAGDRIDIFEGAA